MGSLPQNYFELSAAEQEAARTQAREGDAAHCGYFDPLGPGGVWRRLTNPPSGCPGASSGTGTTQPPASGGGITVPPVQVLPPEGESQFGAVIDFVKKNPVLTIGGLLLARMLMKGRF